ncbi:MAG: Hsp33 family molecular chaperone HslO, partial [Alphaproteobacteria bacterium]|nr:Hsp33 family molecular chaperone HslO [Alphaproteobacteria bacterium]
ARNYTFGCRCSREKLLNTLQTFSQEDIDSMIENNQISASCNFCGEKYVFTPGELHKQ